MGKPVRVFLTVSIARQLPRLAIRCFAFVLCRVAWATFFDPTKGKDRIGALRVRYQGAEGAIWFVKYLVAFSFLPVKLSYNMHLGTLSFLFLF